MEYRSPLGCNFKLEQSLLASSGEKNRETPKKDDFVISDNSGSKIFFDSDGRRNSGGSRNYSPAWQRHSSNWKSPNFRNSQQNEPISAEQLYHPSMLENPWKELEKSFDQS